MTPQIDITRKSVAARSINERLAMIADSDVLVGIPQATTQRKGGKINNASLMYIHTHGSPARNIPARPVIEPALAADGNREPIAEELKIAAQQILQGHATEGLDALRRAGGIGRDASKAWFTDPRNNWAPNKPATIRAKGSDRPLIDTGTLRRSITYVVRQKGHEEEAPTLVDQFISIPELFE